MTDYIPGMRFHKNPKDIGISRCGLRWGAWERLECYDADLGKTGEVCEWLFKGTKKEVRRFLGIDDSQYQLLCKR